MNNHLWPRLMNEVDAGTYIGYSKSWMRNTRYEDTQRIANDKPAKGPKFIKQGSNVRYLLEHLDEWIDQFVEGDVDGWEDRECNTSGLKHVGGES